jgi:hypothetical protein
MQKHSIFHRLQVQTVLGYMLPTQEWPPVSKEICRGTYSAPSPLVLAQSFN